MSVQQIPESASRERGLRAWMAVLDATLAAIERTAWQGRELAEQAVQAWQMLEKGAGEFRQEYEQLADEAAAWPGRLKRLSSTGWMLTRVTASYRLWGIRSAFFPASRLHQARHDMHRKNALRFRDTSLEQGGAFLKIGQLLSARGDILPEPWIDALQILQDQASAESFEAIRQVVEAELGESIETLFDSFEEDPVAAASIGQVHRARLKDGRDVAVKVQRPGLDEIIQMDMVLMKHFLDSIASLLPPTDLETIRSEIERTVREELDYEAELHWMMKIREFLAPVPRVIVPEPVSELCTRRVLVSEFIEGVPLSRALEKRQAQGDDAGVADLLGRLLDLYLRQVLQAGCFQADPHPGNFLVTPDDQLVVLDFGATMALSENFRQGYYRVLGAALVDDSLQVGEQLLALGFETRSGRPDTLLAFSELLIGQLKAAAMDLASGQMHWPTVDDLLLQGEDLLTRSHQDPVVKIPAEFIMLARVFTTLGGLFTHYQPAMDVQRYLFPHMVGPALAQVAP